MINILFLPVLFILGMTQPSFSGEVSKQVTAALQGNNAQEVSRYFNAMVDLTLPGYDDTYSKAQAGQILREFLTQNPVKSFKITRQGTSPDGSDYTIGTLETAKKSYRLYFLIKMTGGQDLIQQFQIQDL